MVFLRFPMVILWFPLVWSGFLCFSYGFSMVFPWFPWWFRGGAPHGALVFLALRIYGAAILMPQLARSEDNDWDILENGWEYNFYFSIISG